MSKFHERDYARRVTDVGQTHFLRGTTVEIISEVRLNQPPRHALFDFDGTLSLIREGWPKVMTPMMVAVLQAAGGSESMEELHCLVLESIMRLNGKQTIYQMIWLAEEVEKRGCVPDDPLVYKQEYLDRLHGHIRRRRKGLESGQIRAEELLVP